MGESEGMVALRAEIEAAGVTVRRPVGGVLLTGLDVSGHPKTSPFRLSGSAKT